MADIRHHITVEGAEAALSKLTGINSAFSTIGDVAQRTTAAMATGGPIAGAFAGGIALIDAGMRQWNREIAEQARLVTDAKTKEDAWLESAKRGIGETAAKMKLLTTEQLHSAAILADLQVSHVAEARFAALQQMTAAKVGTDERNKYAQIAHDKAVELAESQTAREVAWKKYGVAQDRVSNMEILVNKREAAEEAARIEAERFQRENGDRVRTLDDYKKFLADEKAARLKAIADAKAAEDEAARSRYKLFRLDNDMFLSTAQDRQKIADEVANVQSATDKRMAESTILSAEFAQGKTLTLMRIAQLRKEQLAQDEEDRTKARRIRMDEVDRQMAEGNLHVTEEEYARLEEEDDDLTKARIANRQAETDATISALQRQEVAQRAATAGEYAQMAATAAFEPVAGALTAKLRELGEVNQENFSTFTDFSHEMPAIAAKMAQAILAGIAIQAVGESAKNMALAAGATASGLVALATPGGQASAAGYFAGAAGHVATAGLWAALAGGTGAGALGVGMLRGGNGPIPLTSEERKALNDKNATGGNSSSGGGGVRGGSISGQSSEKNDTYVQIVMMPGALMAGTRDAIQSVSGMVAAGSRDEFMSRANGRRP